MDYPDYRDYRDGNQSLLGLAAHGATALSSSYAGVPERMVCNEVTGNYFEVLAVQPAAGRLLVEADDAETVISYGVRQRKFGGGPGAIGARIDLNGNPFTIVGVAEKGFRGTVASQAFDLWVPLRTQPRTWPGLSTGIMDNRSAGWLLLFGRLKPGAGVRQVDAEMKTIAARLAHSRRTGRRPRFNSCVGHQAGHAVVSGWNIHWLSRCNRIHAPGAASSRRDGGTRLGELGRDLLTHRLRDVGRLLHPRTPRGTS